MNGRMHSSGLRGNDFELTRDGVPVSHTAFFADLSDTDRLGVFSPDGGEGVGASLLILAHVTAFYDRYRARGDDFFAYPDYFTFQRRSPCVAYGSFDVWPAHKNVTVGSGYGDTLAAITDRAVSVLAVPARSAPTRQERGAPNDADADANLDRLRLASARRTIRRCYLYSATGQMNRASLLVSCTNSDAAEWIGTTARAAGVDIDPAAAQSYREVSLDQALAALH